MAKAKSKDPDIEIKANLGDPEKWKKWSKDWDKNSASKSSHGAAGASGGLYFLGFIGALIYWMQAVTDFGSVLTGIFKSLVWPAYIVYKLLESFYGVVN